MSTQALEIERCHATHQTKDEGGHAVHAADENGDPICHVHAPGWWHNTVPDGPVTVTAETLWQYVDCGRCQRILRSRLTPTDSQ